MIRSSLSTYPQHAASTPFLPSATFTAALIDFLVAVALSQTFSIGMSNGIYMCIRLVLPVRPKFQMLFCWSLKYHLYVISLVSQAPDPGSDLCSPCEQFCLNLCWSFSAFHCFFVGSSNFVGAARGVKKLVLAVGISIYISGSAASAPADRKSVV